jgi:hypothetical protein
MAWMTQAWIVRVGQANRRAAAFQNPPAIGLGWAEARGLGDLDGMELDAVATLVRKTGGDRDEAAAEAEQLLSFRDLVSVGDLVIAPDAFSGDVLVGSVTGEYAYGPPGDYYPHRRSVEWVGRVRSAEVPAALEGDTRGSLTLRPADDTGDAWLALARAAAPVERRPRAVAARPARTPRAATGSSAAPKKAATRKPPAKKKPVAQPDRVCPGCGYSWPASQFADGDLCVECRS